METGRKILNLMERGNVSRSELAKAVNINYQTLCKYLQDNRSIPEDILVEIADYFNVSLDFLMDREVKCFEKNNSAKYIELAMEIEGLNHGDRELIKSLVKSLNNKKDK